MSKIIHGYAVVNKEGKRAPTKRAVYDTKNAAAAGFYQASKYGAYGLERHEGKKLSEQDEYRVVALVAADE